MLKSNVYGNDDYFVPVEPKPPAPLSVSSKESTSME